MCQLKTLFEQAADLIYVTCTGMTTKSDGVIYCRCHFSKINKNRNPDILQAFFKSNVDMFCDSSVMPLFNLTQIPAVLLVPSLIVGLWAGSVVLHPV